MCKYIHYLEKRAFSASSGVSVREAGMASRSANSAFACSPTPSADSVARADEISKRYILLLKVSTSV
jgi:hypothetical protein